METKDFNEIASNRLAETKKVLIDKGHGYAPPGTDRLVSFKRAGQILDQDPVEALDGMWVKHRVSIAEAIDRMAKDPDFVPTKEWVTEKLGDNLNYTLLLEGLIEERRLQNESNDVQRHADITEHVHCDPERYNCSSVRLDDAEIEAGYHQLARSINEVFDISGTHKHSGARVVYDSDRECIKIVLGATDTTPDRIFHLGVPALR